MGRGTQLGEARHELRGRRHEVGGQDIGGRSGRERRLLDQQSEDLEGWTGCERPGLEHEQQLVEPEAGRRGGRATSRAIVSAAQRA